MISVFIFDMKQNVRETESNWRFGKNVETCLQNKKAYQMPLMAIFIRF